MRKIEAEMLYAIRHAFDAGPDWGKSGTEVLLRGNGAHVEVYLHGNAIARILRGGTMAISLAGYNTQTTRSRLNVLLGAFAKPARYPQGLGVFTERGQAYLADADGKRPITDEGWYIANLGHDQMGGGA